VVRGTCVPVRAIVVAWREYRDMRTILAAYPRLSDDDSGVALSYYEAHRNEVDERIQAQFAEH
jgi:uncharacterized protein (DUF433 family)